MTVKRVGRRWRSVLCSPSTFPTSLRRSESPKVVGRESSARGDVTLRCLVFVTKIAELRRQVISPGWRMKLAATADESWFCFFWRCTTPYSAVAGSLFSSLACHKHATKFLGTIKSCRLAASFRWIRRLDSAFTSSGWLGLAYAHNLREYDAGTNQLILFIGKPMSRHITNPLTWNLIKIESVPAWNRFPINRKLAD